MPYSEIFNDHIANPRNAGELTGATHVAEATNPACGDRMTLALRVREGLVEDARFLAYGCPPTLVCGSAYRTDQRQNCSRGAESDQKESCRGGWRIAGEKTTRCGTGD